MANKINEIIDVINSGETVEGLTARVDNLEDNLDAFEEQTNDNFANLEDWVVISDESEIFDTVDGNKYFKHDTYLYYNGLGSRIRGYFIKGFPKAKVKIDFTYVDSQNANSFGYVYEEFFVNDDSFTVRESTSEFEFNQSPPRSSNDVTVLHPEYGTSYDDTGDYGKVIMLVRNTGS